MQHIPGIRFCKVVDIKDETGRGMIKIEVSNGKYVDAFPLLPKTFYVKPKLYEGVFVFFTDASNDSSQAYYIGPVISQEHEMDRDSFDQNTAIRGSEIHPDVNPASNPNIKPLFPKDEEVWMRSRKDAEIQMTDEEVRIRAGVRLTTTQKDNDWGLKLNTQNPTFAKFKYHPIPIVNNGVHSTATIVADKINIIGNNSKLSVQHEIDGNELLTSDTIENFIKNAEKVPYGKKLVALLKLIIEAIVTHTHPYPMMPSVNPIMGQLEAERITQLDTEALLSDSIRIN